MSAPLTSTPRFGAIYTVVGPQEDLKTARKALQEKAKAQKLPIFVRGSRDFDLEHQGFANAPEEGKLRAYTGKLDATLGRIAAIVDAPFYAVRTLAGLTVRDKEPKTQLLTRQIADWITLIPFAFATHVVGALAYIPDLILNLKEALQSVSLRKPEGKAEGPPADATEERTGIEKFIKLKPDAEKYRLTTQDALAEDLKLSP